MATDRQTIYNEIDKERTYQLAKWGARTDDTVNTPWMWAAYLAQYSTGWMNGKFAPLSPADVDRFRESMIKAATLAIAAVESIDRQRAYNGAAFFEESPEEGAPYASDFIRMDVEEFFRSLGVEPQIDMDEEAEEACCGHCQEEIEEPVSIKLPEEIRDLFDRLGNLEPFTTDELVHAANFFMDLEEELNR